jgi:NhaP-type Na+/H+ or K+/H+ antiporter
VQQVLVWEGSLIDPVGGILGALVFHGVMASTRKGPAGQIGQFVASISVGLAGGVIGVALLWLLLLIRPRCARRCCVRLALWRPVPGSLSSVGGD